MNELKLKVMDMLSSLPYRRVLIVEAYQNFFDQSKDMYPGQLRRYRWSVSSQSCRNLYDLYDY